MRTRSEELRRRHRRVLAWSLAAAALLHVVVFLVLPGLRTEGMDVGDGRLEGVNASRGALVDVLFGPPEISEADGTTWQEPPERRLQVVRLVRLPADCTVLRESDAERVGGRVRLTVDAAGQVDVVRVTEGTGHACADRVITQLAGDLHYHWLPDERFAAPVDLIQPVTLVETVAEVDARPVFQ